MRTFIFSSLMFICFLQALSARENHIAVFSEKTGTPPLIDGNSDDKCWASIPSVRIPDEKNQEIKVCHDNENIFILLSFEAPEEFRGRNGWRWDHALKAYLPENGKEETAYIFISPASPSEKPGDLWIWRAGRTDPSGFAEDLYVYGKNENALINYDSGTICWYSRYFGKFAGEKLPRFFQRTPSGSAADVKARGKWSRGAWTIEFARKFNTGNGDDVDMDLNSGIIIRFSENGDSVILKKKTGK